MAQFEDDLPELASDADEDETLRYAIALSIREQRQSSANAEVSAKPAGKAHNSVSFGTLKLDRKSMEAERLKRLGSKRPKDASESDSDVVEIEPPAKKKALSTGPSSSTVTPPASSAKHAPKFYDGTVKRTWTFGYPRTPDDIKIEEVFQKDQLELALLSSYQWDDEWLLSKVDTKRTKLLLLAFADGKAQVRN